MTDRKLDDIFAKTLVDDYDDDAPWAAVNALRGIGSRDVFDYAVAWCRSGNSLRRARGADVLAQLGKTSDHPVNFADESFAILVDQAGDEIESLPLLGAIHALGHLGNPLAVPSICQHRLHPNADVRFAVACALGSFANDPIAVETLLLLTQDVDEDVRDWATFGLGVLGNSDSPEIRDALARCLDDTAQDVREEAMAGLASRKDRRAVPALLTALEGPRMSEAIREAASEMLGREEEAASWTGTDYARALRERFGPKAEQ